MPLGANIFVDAKKREKNILSPLFLRRWPNVSATQETNEWTLEKKLEYLSQFWIFFLAGNGHKSRGGKFVYTGIPSVNSFNSKSSANLAWNLSLECLIRLYRKTPYWKIECNSTFKAVKPFLMELAVVYKIERFCIYWVCHGFWLTKQDCFFQLFFSEYHF